MGRPLTGVRVLELAGLGPAPFAGMLLADLGADVVRIDRVGRAAGALAPPQPDLLGRGKRSIVLDLHLESDVATARALASQADVLLEGFRPGVAERLGLGPESLHAVNPRLVYGRATGWGQDGPLRDRAGHDIAYLALTGILHAIGPTSGPPIPPLNLLGDFGGGGMLLAVGVLAGLLTATRTGSGPVVDASIVDGSALLGTLIFGMLHSGVWQDRRSANMLDGGAPFYRVYECQDGKHIAVGALEPRFYTEFVAGLGGPEALGEDPPDQYDISRWDDLRSRIARCVATRTRDEWASVFAGTDACVAPVLSLREAAAGDHPQLALRGTFVTVDGVAQPGVAPRFDGVAEAPGPPVVGEQAAKILAGWLD